MLRSLGTAGARLGLRGAASLASGGGAGGGFGASLAEQAGPRASGWRSLFEGYGRGSGGAVTAALPTRRSDEDAGRRLHTGAGLGGRRRGIEGRLCW